MPLIVLAALLGMLFTQLCCSRLFTTPCGGHFADETPTSYLPVIGSIRLRYYR